MLLHGQSSAALNVVAFFGVWIGVWLPIAVPIAIALKWRPFAPLAFHQKLPLVASLYAIAPLILWGTAQFEAVPFSSFGIAWDATILQLIGVGLGLGILGLGLVFGIQYWLGWLEWDRDRHAILRTAVIPTLFLALWVSLTEELVFRGFLVNELQRDYSIWTTAIASSLIFALLHLVWEGRENLPQLPGLWLMGMILVLARWCDGGSLGLAIGLHAGWVWGIASLDTAEVIHYRDRAPTWITGLDGKPLAGLLGLTLLLATGGIVWGIGRGF